MSGGVSIQARRGTSTQWAAANPTLKAGQTSVDVTHGLAAAPTRVQLTPTTATAGKDPRVTAKAATTFTITIESAHSADISFDWSAVV